MRFEIVKIIFFKELREMLRDRRSLAVVFGIPLVLYPLFTLLIANLGASREKNLQEKTISIGVLRGTDVFAPHLMEQLSDPKNHLHILTEDTAEEAAAALKADLISGFVNIPPNAERDAFSNKPVEIGVEIDRSRNGANYVEDKLDGILDQYNQWIIKQRLAAAGVSASVLEPVKEKTSDVASAEQRFGIKLSLILPMLLLVTGMLGALFPALNATTAERELGTLETLLVTPAGRTEILVAKGSLVFLTGIVTAGLNMLSMSLVIWRAVSQVDKTMGAYNLNLATLGLSFLATVPALIFFSTLVLIVGLIARNFREANSFATPVMMLPLSSILVAIADPKTTPALLITPVAGTTVIIRDVLLGRATAMGFALVVGSSCLYAVIMLSVAARVFTNEQLVNPSWEALSLHGFGRARRRPLRLPAIDEALGLAAFSMVLLFYLAPSFQHWGDRLGERWNIPGAGLFAQLTGNEILVVLGPALLAAWLFHYRKREVFSWKAPAFGQCCAAILIGVGMSPVINALNILQERLFPPDPNVAKAQLEILGPALLHFPIFTIAGAAVLAAFCEELLYRGPIQKAFMRKMPAWIAIGLTALLFAAAHLDFYNVPLRAAVALAFGWMVFQGGSIFPAMIAHGIFDATQLGQTAWELRRQGMEAAIKEANQVPALHGSDMALIVLGAILVAAGCWWFSGRATKNLNARMMD